MFVNLSVDVVNARGRLRPTSSKSRPLICNHVLASGDLLDYRVHAYGSASTGDASRAIHPASRRFCRQRSYERRALSASIHRTECFENTKMNPLSGKPIPGPDRSE